MRKYLISFLLVCLTLLPSAIMRGTTFGNETLHYVITYKWGLVTKDAGEATLSLRNKGKNYQVILTAKTKPWADKIFKVRDTLRATILSAPFRPIRYEKISHEGGKYAKDVITFTYSGSKTTAKVNRVKVKKGKVKRSTRSFSAQQEAFDMLSIFYYLRTVNYAQMPKGRSIRKIIFSGSKSETITITNLGLQNLKLRNGSTAKTYHIRFRFTSKGGKKSSADMDTWISAAAPHIPYQLEGQLPLGKIKCYLVK